MEIDVKQDCADVDWKKVSETLKSVGMAYYEPEIHRRAFEASHTTVFIYHGDRLIGFGRQFQIGAYQAAVYDCAVLQNTKGSGSERRSWTTSYLVYPIAMLFCMHHPEKKGSIRNTDFGR